MNEKLSLSLIVLTNLLITVDGVPQRGRHRDLGCTSNQFQCDNNECVLASYKCDGDNDCGDNSDESGCSRCLDSELECNLNGLRICIQSNWKCDGVNDCDDNSDEQYCEPHADPPDTDLELSIGSFGTTSPTPTYTFEYPSYVPEETTFNEYTEYGRHQECSDLMKEKVWNHWSTWTNCKYTNTGYRRRRYSDLLRSIPPSIDTDCLKTTIVDEEKDSNSRLTHILTNYYESAAHTKSQYRAAQQEQCRVEDEFPDVCTNMQFSELVDWCKSDELYPKCRKTCKETNPAIRDYGACMNLEHRCGDGFCLDWDQIADGKVDCINQAWDQMSEKLVLLGVDEFGLQVSGTDICCIEHVGSQRWVKAITKIPFSNCDRCFGKGTRSRKATVLQDQTNADFAGGSDTETISCNEHKQYESCGEVQGYLDFGQFIPINKESVLATMAGSEGVYFTSTIDVKSWNTSKDAMDACLKDGTCCGVTYSKGFNWTLRNGGSVNKYDGENPISEATILYGKEDFDDGDFYMDIETKKLIWGTKSLRKDCYLRPGKLSSQFCRDTKPEWCRAISGVPNYEKILCSKSFVITACLKTCGLC